ncbi:MAG: hypothetical protein DIU68_007695 [Chloroflexota bacterium]
MQPDDELMLLRMRHRDMARAAQRGRQMRELRPKRSARRSGIPWLSRVIALSFLG